VRAIRARDARVSRVRWRGLFSFARSWMASALLIPNDALKRNPPVDETGKYLESGVKRAREIIYGVLGQALQQPLMLRVVSMKLDFPN